MGGARSFKQNRRPLTNNETPQVWGARVQSFMVADPERRLNCQVKLRYSQQDFFNSEATGETYLLLVLATTF